MKREDNKKEFALSNKEMVTTFGGYAPTEKPDEDPLEFKLPDLEPIIFDPRCW